MTSSYAMAVYTVSPVLCIILVYAVDIAIILLVNLTSITSVIRGITYH